MNDRDQRRYDRLTRIQTFGRDNAADFVPTGKAAGLFAAIDTSIAALDDAKAGQIPGRVSKETLLDSLVLDFKNIARTARAIALTENGFDVPCRIPNNPSEIAIASHADALLLLLEDQSTDSPETKTAKAALRARFITYELPADFVADLRADREALRETNRHNQGETQEGVENTKRIGDLLAKASRLVQELDALIKNKYTRDTAKLAAWRTASHVERTPQREKNTPPPAPTA